MTQQSKKNKTNPLPLLNDEEIRRRLQEPEAEESVPSTLQRKILARLEQLNPETPPIRSKKIYLGRLAAAATILLIIGFTLMAWLFQPKTPEKTNPGATEIVIDVAKLEGKPAQTYIVSPKDSEITVVWIET